MKTAYIVSSVRTPVGRAKRGSLRHERPEDMGAAAIEHSIQKVQGLTPDMVDDVLIGCAMPEGEQGMNMGRIIALNAGLPEHVSAATINRFCSSGLQTIAMASQSIMAGQNEVVVAGGAESMSLVPMSGFHFQPHPGLSESQPDYYINMGLTAENVAERYDIPREDQDEWAYHSHMKAFSAIQQEKFKDEIVPLEITTAEPVNGHAESRTVTFDTDEGPRPDTTIEALSGLKPVFKNKGTITAGNTSQMSDGAAATVVMSEQKVKETGAEPIARLAGFATAGVAPDEMGIGPIEAIPKVLRQTGLKLSDIGLVELNEAFASQVLAIIRKLEIDPEIVNVNGGAIALGHPLGCTGAKLTASLIHEMQRRNEKYGICTMCIGGGMGAAGVIELL